uniref:Secreted protein n=1 Tax=Romanomermis culicivorax TaxID=13658 RepID=A0A915K4L9_ROMCU
MNVSNITYRLRKSTKSAVAETLIVLSAVSHIGCLVVSQVDWAPPTAANVTTGPKDVATRWPGIAQVCHLRIKLYVEEVGSTRFWPKLPHSTLQES